MLVDLRKELKSKFNSERAEHSKSFFKTGKGEYAEGDIFLGLSMPEQREIVGRFWKSLSFGEIQELLDSKLHEERMVGLLVLVKKYESGVESKGIYDLYLKNTRNINNWDLVDVTTPRIVGAYLLDRKRDVLYKLVRSNNLWERRISVLATFAFIRNKEFDDSLKIAEILLKDKHDLIHKAVGWMLREIGKRDVKVLEGFLKKHYRQMPRTMLRYSIEKFEEKKRKFYMN